MRVGAYVLCVRVYEGHTRSYESFIINYVPHAVAYLTVVSLDNNYGPTQTLPVIAMAAGSSKDDAGLKFIVSFGAKLLFDIIFEQNLSAQLML